MRIVYFYRDEWEKEFVASRLPVEACCFVAGSVNDHPEFRDEEAEALSVFISSKMGAAEFDRFPKLRVIATRSTGFDHIDLVEAGRRGIVVANVPAYGEYTVAEFSVALLLALSRKVYDAVRRVRSSGSFSQEDLRGFELAGKTIGIIGTGHIGEHMIALVRGFGMNVIAYDVFPKQGLPERLGFRYVGLDELLASSDVISLHAPYNPHTHHMLNAENMTRIKRGSYLVNTARGGLVDTAALVRALDDGTIAGAALDVLEEEGELDFEEKLLLAEHPNEASLRTTLANHYLMRHPRVLVSPHVAFNTQEAIERILATTVENIKAFARGEAQNIVSPK